MTLSQGHDVLLGRVQSMIERSHGPDTDCGYAFTFDLELGDMTLSQSHDTPLGHE